MFAGRKVITVFGATGSQGGAVARTLSKDPQLHVRAITRDIYSEKAQCLKNDGVDLIPCNLDDVNSIRSALIGADGVFVVTYTDFKDPDCLQNEIRQGCLIADACIMAEVQHIVFSTQLHAEPVLGIPVRHFDAKAVIEKYLHDRHLPVTCIMVPIYYEELLGLFKPIKYDGCNYSFEIPMGTNSLDLICINDIGEVVRQIFLNKNCFLNKTVSVSGDKLTVKEVAAILSAALKPKTFKDRPITVNEYRLKNVPGIKDWANMFNFFLRVDQKYNVASTKEINPSLISFKEWVRANATMLSQAFENGQQLLQ